MKYLIYVTKSKWRMFFDKIKNIFSLSNKKVDNDLNGKIVAEFDGEVEEIEYKHIKERDNLGILHNETWYEYRGLNIGHYDCELTKKSCLSLNEIFDYLDDKTGYAIHIKNLISYGWRDLEEFFTCGRDNVFRHAKRPPQNMMKVWAPAYPIYCYSYPSIKDEYILISIRPEWACKILNGEKTIEVRRKVLKEMKPCK